MSFTDKNAQQRAYDLFSKMPWSDRETCGYTQPLMSYSHTIKDISSLTEYTTRKAYDGARKSITVAAILMYVAIGGTMALISTALAQRACLLPWDGNALEYVLLGTLLAIVAYMIYAVKRSFSSTIRMYEENINTFETPDELIERMRKHAPDSCEQQVVKDERAEIDELTALIANANRASNADIAAPLVSSNGADTLNNTGDLPSMSNEFTSNDTEDITTSYDKQDETAHSEKDGMETDETKNIK